MLYLFRKENLLLVISSVILTFFGLVTVFDMSGDNALFYKQLIIFFVSFTSMLVISKINFSFLKNSNVLILFYILMFLMLCVLLVFGYTNNGAQSWFRIAGVSLQPAEFAKLAIIGVLAKYFYKRHIEIANFWHIIVSFLYTAFIGILVLIQPDLGSALVIFGIWAVVLVVSGVSKKHILVLFSLGVALSAFAWQFVFVQYQKDRILNFIDPVRDIRGSGYNVYQSMIAVGSGGLYGKGVDFGTQSNLKFLPEFETDFIFAAFSEEWGFVGVSIVLLLFFVLISTLFYVSVSASTNFETLYIVGISAYFIIHFTVNVGMNIGLLPVTGIPLPFMSAGGTHILMEYMMIGLVISFSKSRNSKRLENNKIML